MVHVAGRKENLKQYHGQGAGMVQTTQGPMPRPSEFFVEMALEAAQNEHHRLYRWCSKFFSDIQKNILISIHEVIRMGHDKSDSAHSVQDWSDLNDSCY